MITDDDARENKATTSCYPSLATAGQKPPPPSSARKNTIELGFNFFNSKEQKGNDMSEEGVKKSNKSRSARPFNRVNDEEWLNEKNKKGDNKFRNAHGVGNYRKNLGYKAEQKFVQKQGKQFAHEKNKEKKRRVYRGGKIETNAVNSRVLFDSSSDEDEVL
ncbi:unnamed protein product [Bathycoccus prasinos]|jgi:hypothetical protein